MSHFKFFLIISLLMLTSGCGQMVGAQPREIGRGASPTPLTVFAAASLTEAFTELGQQFEAVNPEVTVSFNFAGSQQLAQQLAQGAPADVFASANTTRMDVVIDAGRVVSGTQQIFVENRLVVIYPNDRSIDLNRLQDLAQPGIRIILATEEVPVGRYSLEFLDKAAQDPTFGPDFEAQVLNNVVSYEQNVRAVLTKIALGEGDAGLVYASDLVGIKANQVGRIDIPDDLNRVATYPIAVIADTRYPAEAAAFVEFVLSAAGQEILTRYGFIPTQP